MTLFNSKIGLSLCHRPSYAFRFVKPWPGHVHTSVVSYKIQSNNSKSKSSNEWITRQLNDPYVKKARYANYRARSAFKLIEIDDRFKILQPGMCAVELGAAPGAWTQVLINRLNSDGLSKENAVGKVISVDLLNIAPLPGAIILNKCDFMLKDTKNLIHSALDGSAIDIVLSDMAANATGVKDIDKDVVVKLAYEVLVFSVENLKPEGHLLIKVLDSGLINSFVSRMEKFFDTIKRVKPGASREDSSEVYLLGRKFIGKK